MTESDTQEQSEPNLILVSNRLPVVLGFDDKGSPTVSKAPGGLVSAFEPVMSARRGTWVGWAGVSGRLEFDLRDHSRERGYSLLAVELSAAEVSGYYEGFSNEVLWPLFHDFFSACVFDPAHWRQYLSVNRKFAEATAAVCRDRDIVWVQDYHLAGVGSAMGALGLTCPKGFFLHIPFPPPDIFGKLPWRTDLLRLLLAYDLIGFQTARDLENFVSCASTFTAPLELEEVKGGVRIALGHDGPSDRRPPAPHTTLAKTFPISIDTAAVSRSANSDSVNRTVRHLKRELKGRRAIVGIERLDYSKGIPQRLEGFRSALIRYPRLHGKITLLQHVMPSREAGSGYQALKLEIEHLVGAINGQFSLPGWVPIHYFYHTLGFEDVLAYYRVADIALVTPLKDGMNLVAKEYCAARNSEDGVLVLSEFAGAARELGRSGALLINPYDVEAFGDAILTAYDMGLSEQHERMRALRRTVAEHDVYAWSTSYLAALSEVRSVPR